MELLIHSTFVVAYIFVSVSSQEISTTTYYKSSLKRLSCNIGTPSTAVWTEQFSDSEPIQLFSYFSSGVGDGVTRDAPSGGKYDNFDYTFEDTSFDIIISNVEKNDGGKYRCFTVTPVKELLYTLTVEVPTENATIDCQPCTNSPPVCECRCSALAGFPGNLSLVWIINPGQVPLDVITNSVMTEDGLYNYSSTASLEVDGNNAELKCSVNGYKHQDILEENFSDGLGDTVTLSSPECQLRVTEVVLGVCTAVNLHCLCTGFPPADNFIFYTRNNKQDTEIPGSSGSSTVYEVDVGSNTTFLCLGSNGIPYAENTSAPVLHQCLSSGGNTAAIVVGVVGGCVGVAVIVIIIIVILKKRENGVEGKSNDNTDGNGVNAKLAASQPETTEPAEYASVNKPKSQPQAAPRSSAPPEKMELQYADIDHGNRGPSNEIRQPADAPTEYATVQSVIV